jgi:threonine aldolase
MGGGMRQAGYIAAGCLYALHHHIDRLKTDHWHAQKVAEALSKKIFVQSILPVETNIIIFEVGGDKTAAGIVQNLAENDIKCIAISPTQIRMVFHLDVSDKMVDHLIQVIEKL